MNQETASPVVTTKPANLEGRVLPIARYDDPLLRQVSRPVSQGEFQMPEFQFFIASLKATMKAYRGAGLSGIQCGVPARVIIIQDEYRDIVMVNPVIKEIDAAEVSEDEGCLSYPGAFTKVTRPKAVKVAFQDADGKVKEEVLRGIQARAVFHEIEHLDGQLLIDHVRSIDREKFRMQLTKFGRMVKKYAPKKVNSQSSKKALQKAKKAARKASRR